MSASILNPLYPKPTPQVASQRLVVSSSAVQITTAPNQYTNTLMFDVQTDDVFVTVDGSTPSSTNGHRLYAGKAYTWSRAMVVAAKFIRANTDASIYFSELAA